MRPFGTYLALILLVMAPPASARPVHHRHHAHRTAPPARPPVDPTPDCRYPDGTPFDPDIIGGRNHVGDGGPAVNLGGYPPCGY